MSTHHGWWTWRRARGAYRGASNASRFASQGLSPSLNERSPCCGLRSLGRERKRQRAQKAKLRAGPESTGARAGWQSLQAAGSVGLNLPAAGSGQEKRYPRRGTTFLLRTVGAKDGGRREGLCNAHLFLRVPDLRIEVVDLDIVAGGIFGGKHAACSHVTHFSQDLNRL